MSKEAAETLLFEREKLYEEIWAEPMMQVAKRYGISDVGLAKICKKLSIPRPPRGYWTKKILRRANQEGASAPSHRPDANHGRGGA